MKKIIIPICVVFIVFLTEGIIACPPEILEWHFTRPDQNPEFSLQYHRAKPTSDCNCDVSINISFTDSPDHYPASIFVPYASALNRANLSISESGCYPVGIKFYDTEWNDDADARGITIYNADSFGYIEEAAVDINLTFVVVRGDTILCDYTTEQTGIDSLSTVVLHEVGHCLGMDHRDNTVMCPNPIMTEFYQGIRVFNSNELEDLDCLYGDDLHDLCESGFSPAFFGQIEWELESLGCLFSIETLWELNVSELIIKRAPVELGGWPLDDDFSEIGRFDLEFPKGGNYSFWTSGGEAGDIYLLEAIGSNGQVHNSTYIQCGRVVSRLDYPTGAIDEMRVYSLSKMHYPQWKSIFSGEREVQSVANTNSPSCDFLVIAFDDFVQDISPICDYWQWFGFDVELVSCNGEIHGADQIRNYIARAHAKNPLQAVWLVGSPDPGGENVDLVPTYSKELGFDFLYSDLNSDGLMDVPVGRLPAQATREVVFYANKELRYHVETTWGGKKDPRFYSTPMVISVPDDYPTGSSSNWDLGQWLVYNTAVECAMNLVDYVGWGNVEFINSPDLEEWGEGDIASFRDAIRDVIFRKGTSNCTYRPNISTAIISAAAFC